MVSLKRLRVFKFFMLWAVVSGFLVPGYGRPRGAAYEPAQDETAVLKNLLTAYNIESNTCTLYRAFSEKAGKEGYLQVALLFRAVLGSVTVQMENHADAIKEMAGTPKSDLKTPMVKATGENLQGAIKQESDKFSNVYPAFLANARQERDKMAVRTFNYSKSAAEDHLNLFKEAYADPARWEKAAKRFWVCSVCGNVVTALNFTECPVCFNPLSKYGEVK